MYRSVYSVCTGQCTVSVHVSVQCLRVRAGDRDVCFSMAFGNECGLAIVDVTQKTVLLNLGTPDLYGRPTFDMNTKPAWLRPPPLQSHCADYNNV